MNKSDLYFLQSTLIMERLFGEDPLLKRAQEGGDGGVFATIKNEVSKLIDLNKDHPVESILGFIGPGLLFMFGFKKFAAAFALAEALGFSWEHFFTSIRAKIEPLLTDMHNGKERDTSDIKAIVQDAGEEAFSGEIDVDKLQEATEKYSSLNNMLFIMKVADRYKQDPALMRLLGPLLKGPTGGRFRKGILGFIVRVVFWLVSAVAIAAGFKLVGKGVAHILGIKDKKDGDAAKPEASSGDGKDVAISDKDTHPEDKDLKLKLNHNANQDLFTTTYNDDKHIWTLQIPMSQLHGQLITWAQQLYPQLTDEGAFDTSSAFNRTIRMFKERNSGGSGQLGVIGVPAEFKSIKGIIDSFAADVASHMTNSTNAGNLRYA
jgi:hypothetical protein